MKMSMNGDQLAGGPHDSEDEGRACPLQGQGQHVPSSRLRRDKPHTARAPTQTAPRQPSTPMFVTRIIVKSHLGSSQMWARFFWLKPPW
jgi:hypothetical protein